MLELCMDIVGELLVTIISSYTDTGKEIVTNYTWTWKVWESH